MKYTVVVNLKGEFIVLPLSEGPSGSKGTTLNKANKIKDMLCQ